MSITEASGRRFECPENVNADVISVCGGGPGDEGEYGFVRIDFKQPPHVLDVGANVGAFAYYATKRWPGCTIDCYEPNPEALAYLEKNTRVFAPRATVHAVGVTSAAGVHTMYRSLDRFGAPNILCSTFRKDMVSPVPGPDESIAFNVNTIAAHTLPPCTILKVDTEGYELNVIAGLVAAQEKLPTLILAEIHTRADRRAIENCLDDAGYELIGARIHSANVGVFAFVRTSSIPLEQRAR